MATVLGGLGLWRAEQVARPVLVEVPFPAFAQLPALPPLPLPPPTMDAPAASIRVRLVSGSSGAPLAGARVSLIRGLFMAVTGDTVPDETALTDVSGVAFFEAPGAGVMTVCARGAGHAESCERDVGVVSGGSLSVALTLPPGAVVEGQVLQHDGTPAAGVRLIAPGDNLLAEMTPSWSTTDAQGRYTLDGVTPGSVQVRLFAPQGRALDRYPGAELTAGEVRRFDIQLGAFVPVTVKPVMGRTRGTEAVESVHVNVQLEPQADGTFTGIAESGRYSVSMWGRRNGREVAARKDVTLAPGAPAVIAFPFSELKSAGMVLPWFSSDPGVFEVSGRVFLSDGAPVKGAWIGAQKPGPRGRRCGSSPDDHAHVRFDGPEFVVTPRVGAGRIFAWLPDGRAGSAAVRGGKGERVSVDIHLEETGAVAAVMDFGDGHLWGSRQEITVDGHWVGASHYTLWDGSIFVPGLKPGKHVLRTSNGDVEFNVNAREVTNLGVLRRPPEPEAARSDSEVAASAP
ncbi:carboxypeptidase-like regulatory domain-containing protein [Myxococcus sp. AM010]|uniref:carboxypeptidase-like regulatory domain-containing protein n=2 Tax=unclassified Myxococcus TaxID=2648731 RepID=UPI0020D171F6|nr:carboxypeptidase-like regulatory domain-containing protein [Myxococcus sp. AM010]